MTSRCLSLLAIALFTSTAFAQTPPPRPAPATPAATAAAVTPPRPRAPRPRRAPAFDRARYAIAAQDLRARQRPDARRPRGPLGAGRRREPLVPRRLAQRGARQDRVRAPVRALLLQRQRALPAWVPRGDGRPRRQQPQRHDQHRSHQLLRDRAGVRSRAHALPRGRPPRLPRRAHQQGDARTRTRRRAEREAPGREPAVRPRVPAHDRDGLPGRASVQLVHDRQHGRPRRGDARGREDLVPDVLRAEQLRALAGRRHHARRPRSRSSRSTSTAFLPGRRCAARRPGCRASIATSATRWKTACRRRACTASTTRHPHARRHSSI